MGKDVLIPAEVAEMLGVAEGTLTQWRYRGQGPPFVRLGGGRGAAVRYLRADIDAWLKRHRVDPR